MSRRVVFWTVVALAGAIVLAVAGAIIFSFVNGNELVEDAGSGFAAYATIFALVFAEAVKWTADRALWRDLLPAAERALTWCDTYGDPDKDGYIEYGHRPGEMRSQGWKDSAQSLSDPDGKWSKLPAALVEVQAYVYAAKMGVADLYEIDGDRTRIGLWRPQGPDGRDETSRERVD